MVLTFGLFPKTMQDGRQDELKVAQYLFLHTLAHKIIQN